MVCIADFSTFLPHSLRIVSTYITMISLICDVEWENPDFAKQCDNFFERISIAIY